MLREILDRGVLYWLRVPRDNDFRREEWILAAGRLFLGFCLFLAAYSEDSPKLARNLLFLYLVYGLLIILALRARPQSSPFFYIGVHCADILWAAHIALLVGVPHIAFVLLFLLLIGAKLFWGFWEVLLTAAGFFALSLAGTYLYHSGHLWHYMNPSAQTLDILLYCLVTLDVGFLAEAKALRGEKNAVNALIESIRIDGGLQDALKTACGRVIQLFGATQVLVVIHEEDRKRCALFRATGSLPGLQSCELDPSQWPEYLFPAPAPGWRLATVGRLGLPKPRCLVLDSGKMRTSKTECRVPDSFFSDHPLRLLLGVALTFDDGISARVYVIDPMLWFGGVAGLRFLECAVRLSAPTVHNLFQVDRLRTKAEAIAGSRMARELHDGVIQPLASINLQLEELWRSAGPILAKEGGRLATIKENIQKEILSLREFTQELRCLDVDCGKLLPYLSSMALKFQCEHGIAANFVSEVTEVQLRPRVCVELARIVQEALANVRKHSKASEVLIRFSRRGGEYVLGVVDNGRGFGFSGLRSHDELESSGSGPAIIMERAREIRGKVQIESAQGRGSYVEVVFPMEAESPVL
jgi:signal transduction histidine kinase